MILHESAMSKSKSMAISVAPSEFHPWNNPILKLIYGILYDWSYFHLLFPLVLIGECALGVLVVQYISYTEIDWIAYMQEVGGFLSGERDYANLHGDTGPLVYPAGFVYLYSALYYITDYGNNVRLGQYIFLGIYLLLVAIVLSIYRRIRVVPPWFVLTMGLSKRVHSIFMLRLFNDGPCILLLYTSIYYLLRKKYTMSAILFSLALSVKMNILLFAPALFLIYLARIGLVKTFILGCIVLFIQIILALPFLLHAPASYFKGAFNFSRQFEFTWTVNLKMMPLSWFQSVILSRILLILHVSGLIILVSRHFSVASLFRRSSSPKTPRSTLPNVKVIYLLFSSNFIGIIFARSLHYQFYVWYFHTLPFLFYITEFPIWQKLVYMLGIEYCWNVFPATPLSSTLLLVIHGRLLFSLLWGKLAFGENMDKNSNAVDKKHR